MIRLMLSIPVKNGSILALGGPLYVKEVGQKMCLSYIEVL
jgi:hypothetical protein